MEENPNNDKIIDLTVEQSDKSQPDYVTDVDVAAKDVRPVVEFPLSEGVVKSEVSPEDVSKALDETSK
jgi:hypothetical protein